MAYKIAYRNSFERDFKKLKLSVQEFILDVADKIQDGTIQGEQLKGNFQGFYKFPFGHKPEYRLVYKIYHCRVYKDGKLTCMFDNIEHSIDELKSCNGLIEFVLIKTREEMNNLYARPKKNVKKYSR
ncbi:MAG: type II toxin-antitoxin system YafQ family toxin [Tannerella sp.]|jgi:mRNA-degrading endonuclease RelE of RelBE toxin-antitoxin system|nr:type II toxin-antitoxin system YafQ family toxin [Tannerella sp.]